MYRTVLGADNPLPAASPEAALPSCQLSISGSGLAAASAALSVLQTAAGAGAASACLLLPDAQLGSSVSQGSGGLPGMLKSWAAETAGAAVITQQQQLQAPSKSTLQLTAGPRGQQPAFTEQESRYIFRLRTVLCHAATMPGLCTTTSNSDRCSAYSAVHTGNQC